jgi:ribulokinase
MRDGLVLGVDCGTQSLRAALYTVEGRLLAQASTPYPTQRPYVNWAEQDPDDWWQASCRSVRTCLDQAQVRGDAVAAIACDGTSFTGVYSTNDGRPLRPAILWMDLRAAEEAARVEATRDAALDTCGRRISAEWLLPKTLWVAAHEPEVYARTERVVEGVDWLVHRLCGRWVTSNSNASGKRHWKPGEAWPAHFYASIGLDRLAAQSPDSVAYLGEPVGLLLPEAASALGLTAECVVAHAGMDGWTAPVGKNCFASGCASLTLGTSTVLIAETQRPRIIDGVMGPFPDGIRCGFHTYEAGQTSGAATIGWLLGLLGREGAPDAHNELESAAARVPAGSEGLVVFDAWRGNRTPYFDPLARGTICGLTLEHGAAHLYRAILEGCAYGIRNVLDTLSSGGCVIEELRACGSGAASVLWTQIIADVTGRRVLVSEEKQATCLGSAVCAAVACGAYPDLETASAAMSPSFMRVDPSGERGVYDVCFDLYRKTYGNMKDVMHELAHLTRPGADKLAQSP